MSTSQSSSNAIGAQDTTRDYLSPPCTGTDGGTGSGLFTASAHVEPGEESIWSAFADAYLKHLAPENPVEETLAIEIVASAWRLRRCGIVEAKLPEAEDPEALQRSVDRSRSHAHRLFVKSIAELGKLQTERQFRFETLPESQTDPGLVSFRDVVRDLGARVNWQLAVRRLEGDPIANFINAPMPGQAKPSAVPVAPETRFVNSQTAPKSTPLNHPRNAPCSCGSNEKYKRCCGKGAPPVFGPIQKAA